MNWSDQDPAFPTDCYLTAARVGLLVVCLFVAGFVLACLRFA